jgi:hypothetical protein
VIDCTFVGNVGGVGGAAVCNCAVNIRRCTIKGNTGANGSGIHVAEDGDVTVEQCIVSFGVNGPGVFCDEGAIALSCSDIYGNAGGDWVGCIADQLGADGNMSEDPCFCLDSVYLGSGSSCLADNNDCGVLIGARGEGCSDCGGEVPTSHVTWGEIKRGYR